LEYLDETSQRKAYSRELHENFPADSPRLTRLKQFADYASKETLGQVHAGGFLHHQILTNADGTRTAPSQLSNDERKRRISQAWFQHLRKFPSSSENPVIQHRLVFSMSEPFHDRLVEAGINPDRVLQSTMQKVMRKFGDRFHPGDAIGYAYGMHHDTDNLHVHVALCPRTAGGAYVGCSMSRSKTAGNKNQLEYLRQCFEQENQRWEKILASPEKMQEQLAKRFDSDKLLFSPRLAENQVTALRNAQTVEAIRLQNFYQSIRTLEAAIIGKRRYLLAKRNENFVRRLFGQRKSRASRTVDKIARTVDRRSLREMQDLLFRIKRDYRALHKRYSRQYGFSSYANRNTDNPAQRQQNAQ
jgi:hypothetical protein